jgi:putative salt-induced outer membrane protein
MKHVTLTAITALSTLLATTAFAQETVLASAGAGAQNDDLRDSISDEFETERPDAMSNRGRPTGFDGSVAARGTLSDGNTDSANVGIGVDLGYFDGVNGYGLELSYTYGEVDGETTEESLTYELEYRRDFTPKFFGFAKVQGSYDDFASFGDDVFAGFGAGYRIYDTADLQWTVQAGPGYRVASLTDVLDTEIEEGAFAVSSNYYNLIQTGSAITVDTDVIASESDTVAFNSIAFTQNVSNSLALRTSLNTEYHTDPEAGFDNTDHTLGVSLVYSFN